MRTHRHSWNKQDKRKAHELKQTVKSNFQALTQHCFDQYSTKGDRSITAHSATKAVLRYGVVIEVHNINRQKELRIVVRHGCDVFVFNLSGWAVTYWHNATDDNHDTLRHQFTHEHLEHIQIPQSK